MGKPVSDDAIVLRTYDVGEADRFCILLTKSLGRISARANGVRRLHSRRGGSLLMFNHVTASMREDKAGYSLQGTSLIDDNSACYKDMKAFTDAQQGIELVLQFVEEGVPVVEIYGATAGFLRLCHDHHTPALMPVFTLSLLMHLGLLPSPSHSSDTHLPFAPDAAVSYRSASGGLVLQEDDEQAGVPISPQLHRFLRMMPEADFATLADMAAKLPREEFLPFARSALVHQLGATLKVPPVAARMSSGAMPT